MQPVKSLGTVGLELPLLKQTKARRKEQEKEEEEEEMAETNTLGVFFKKSQITFSYASTASPSDGQTG